MASEEGKPQPSSEFNSITGQPPTAEPLQDSKGSLTGQSTPTTASFSTTPGTSGASTSTVETSSTPTASRDNGLDRSTSSSSQSLTPTPSHSSPNVLASAAAKLTPTSSATPRNPSPSRTTPKASPAVSTPDNNTNTQSNDAPRTVIRGLRSRKNSHDVSPSRTPSATPSTTVPSAAAIQRALSAASTPNLQPVSNAAATSSQVPDAPTRLPRAVKPPGLTSSGSNTGDEKPHWPISPRLKSPPPSTASSRRGSLLNRKPEQAPSIVVQKSTPPPTATSIAAVATGSTPALSAAAQGKSADTPSETEETQSVGMRSGLGRGVSASGSTLETVQERGSPVGSVQSSVHKISDEDRPETIHEQSGEDVPGKHTKIGESGSESAGNRSDGRGRRTAQKNAPPKSKTMPPKASYSSLTSGKTRSEASKNMTVETETVSSIPQAALGPPSERGNGRGEGSLRLKPSTETIRPKKDRRRAVRKAPSITSGTASTKADIFEAKVASAVDEAYSSDSEETFVYESNPPDQPQRRHHSRTPSATSMASQTDYRGGVRSINSFLDSHRGVAGKRSMKFANNPYLAEDEDDQQGTMRAGSSRGGGNGIHSHHIGRWGRGGSHPSILDHDSTFHNANKARNPVVAAALADTAAPGSRGSSRPNSPRLQTNYHHHHHPQKVTASRKSGENSAYDVEDGGADDERTPLVGTVRTNRSIKTRGRPNSANIRRIDYYQYPSDQRERSWLSRFAGCVVIFIMLMLVIFGAVGLLFATTKPLYGVSVLEIKDVLVSEQEIMLDLLVEAVNPNVVAVTVGDMDVSVFAKSKHVGTGSWWRDHAKGHQEEEHLIPLGRLQMVAEKEKRRQKVKLLLEPTSAFSPDPVADDPGLPIPPEPTSVHPPHKSDDPIDDPMPERDPQTMLLGRIKEFSSALSFDGSPFQRHPHHSIGELRLSNPGNKTEQGGSERWERVIQHPFELIVRGVLKYTLPLSSRVRTVPVGGSVEIKPGEGDGTGGEGEGAGNGTVHPNMTRLVARHGDGR